MKATWKILVAVMLLVAIAMVSGCKKDKPENTGNNGDYNGAGTTFSDVRVTTYTPQEITATTAKCGGDVIVIQGLSLSGIGVCWSTTPNPTMGESNLNSINHLFTSNWNKPFVCILNELEPNTTYYVRAYALRGLEYYYGEEKIFTTTVVGGGNGGNEYYPPSISVITGEYFITGSVDQPTVIDLDDESAINFKYGFHMESNSETQKELKNMVITMDVTYFEVDGQEQEIYYDTIDLAGKTSYDFENYLFEQKRDEILLMEGIIKAVVTDVDNHDNIITIAFRCKVEDSPEPLVGRTFEWIRKGANLIDNTEAEMAVMGLKWTASYKEVFATIEPLNDQVVMYMCDGDDFDDIVYSSDKYAYFNDLAETANPIEKYRNITIQNSADYNDMLAVVYGEEYFLIRINYAEIETGSYGTQITINGEAK